MMLSNELLLLMPLILVFTLGYLAQTTGLCMVRGVNELKQGNPVFLLAILLSGTFSWVAVLCSFYLDIPVHLKIYSANVWIAVGGLIFGFGTAFNQGCGVSTLSKLSRGDLKMVATILGWLIGWSLLAKLQLNFKSSQLPSPAIIEYSILLILSIVICIWVLLGDARRKKLWLV